MPNPLLSVRQKIQAVIPEIKGEHLFEIGHNKCKYCGVDRIVRDRKSTLIAEHESGGSTREISETSYNMEGGPCPEHSSRPISLADVLRAIHATGRRFSVDDYGTFFEYKADDEEWDNREEWQQIFGGKRYTWHLADPFDQQSPELFEFLDEILK